MKNIDTIPKKMWGLVAFIMLLISPNVVYAATFDMFSSNPNDISLLLLSQLFGDLVSAVGFRPETNNLFIGYGYDPFQSVIKFFNYTCLVIGGILVAYSILSSALSTAHEGIAMGKELNHPAFIIRTALGIAMITPFVGGYCLLQVLIMFIIVQSVGLANTTWQSFFAMSVNNDGKSNLDALYNIRTPSPQAANVVYSTFNSYACLYGASSYILENKNINNPDTSKDPNINTSSTLSSTTTTGLTGDVDSDNSKKLAKNTANRNAELNNSRTEYSSYINYMKKTYGNPTVIESNATQYGLVKKAFTTNTLMVGNKVVPNDMYVYGLIPTGNEAQINSSCGSVVFNMTDQNTSVDVENLKEIEQLAKDKGYIDVNNHNVVNALSKYVKQNQQNPFNSSAVFEIQSKVYAKYSEQIKKVSLEYVAYINNKDFADNTGSNNKTQKYDYNSEKSDDTKLKNIAKELDKIVVNYEHDLSNEIRKAFYSTNSYKNYGNANASVQSITGNGQYTNVLKMAQQNAETLGWSTAGLFYIGITNSISQAQEAATLLPNVIPATYDGLISSSDAVVTTTNPTQYIKRYNGYALGDNNIEGYNVKKYSVSNFGEPQNSSQDKMAAVSSVLGFNLSDLSSTGRHPIVIITEAGHRFMAIADLYNKSLKEEALQNARDNAVKAKENGGKTTSGGGPADNKSYFVVMGLTAITILGAMLAYVIPVMPMLIWFMALLGWLVSVVEAIFMGPLWGAMHVHPEGSKYVGKGASGYSLLVSLALRPTLMILGFIASIVLVQIFGMFVNYLFVIGFDISMSGNNTTSSSWLSTVAAYMIYTIFMATLIFKMFGIITTIPDKSTKWFGGQSGDLGDYANSASQETKNKVEQTSGSLASPYSNLVSKPNAKELEDVRNSVGGGSTMHSSTGGNGNLNGSLAGNGVSVSDNDIKSGSDIKKNNENGGLNQESLPTQNNIMPTESSYDTSDTSSIVGNNNNGGVNSDGDNAAFVDKHHVATSEQPKPVGKEDTAKFKNLHEDAESFLTNNNVPSADAERFADTIASNGWANSNETKGFKELSNEDFNVTKPNEPEKNMDKLVSNISEAFNNPTKVQAMNKGEIQAIDVVKEAINNSDSKFGDERL